LFSSFFDPSVVDRVTFLKVKATGVSKAGGSTNDALLNSIHEAFV
jgi:hypothetical protein